MSAIVKLTLFQSQEHYEVTESNNNSCKIRGAVRRRVAEQTRYAFSDILVRALKLSTTEPRVCLLKDDFYDCCQYG